MLNLVFLLFLLVASVVFPSFPLLAVAIYAVGLVFIARRHWWFLVTYGVLLAAVWEMGGVPGPLQHLALLAVALYVTAIAIWQHAYVPIAGGVAVSSIGYVAAGDPLKVFAPYFAYLAMVAWVAWRLGGGRPAYLIGTSSLVLQTVVLLFGEVPLVGSWHFAPLLVFSLIPLVFQDGGGFTPCRDVAALIISAAGGLAWGLFVLFTKSPDSFYTNLYTLPFLAMSALLVSLIRSPRGFVGGVLVALGIYLLGLYFVPPLLSWLFTSVIPLYVVLAFSLGRSRALVYATAAVVTGLVLIYISPLIYTPAATASLKLGPVVVAPDGTLASYKGGFAKLSGGAFGVVDGVGRGYVYVEVFRTGFKAPIEVDFVDMEGSVYQGVFYIFPDIYIIRIYVLDDVYRSYLMCTLGSELGVGCGGLRLSLELVVTVARGVLLYGLLWFCVLLSPWVAWRLSQWLITFVERFKTTVH
ncbi:hypothetical protein [Pyrobaculum ferrireducens]|uniref:Uncharacterized protein n=1 Tax=Pyrobaculum ferrireducens TaxID=1104324 RepID=G7VGJ5_9CREN|nr:hypothetical protein [Pyrobaculum ferrireducens]AET33095.1 hypothetical protein P186_1681 [Pyrobaculum ferrireducens]